jgi:carboxylate-amine ligase
VTPTAFDEARTPDGAPRPIYAEVLAAVREAGPAALAAQATAAARAAGMAIGGGPGPVPLPVDPVPRVIGAAEWRALAAGLEQRARALDALVEDVYGERRAVAAGALPEEVVETCPYLERDRAGAPAPAVSVGVVGFDVIRCPDGRFAVLEDNLLTPGHVALPAAREALTLWRRVRTRPVEVHDATVGALRGMLGAAGEGEAAILADQRAADASFELRWLSRALGVPIVAVDELRRDGDRVVVRDGGRPLGLLWQRTAEDRLHDDDGGSTALGDLLRVPLLAGTVRVVNRIGCGVADDKRAARYLDAVALALLGEELVLPSVPTLDLAVAGERAEALAAPHEHVFKPRDGAGGREIVFGPRASEEELAMLPGRIGARPGRWVAQRRVAISTHPTVAGDGLEPRPVDLRVFAVRTPAGFVVVPGGVSRYGPAPDSDLVNTSSGGGIKDVWVLPQ